MSQNCNHKQQLGPQAVAQDFQKHDFKKKKSSDTESEGIGQNKNMFLHLYVIYYPRMSAENHNKPNKTATSLLQFEPNRVIPEHTGTWSHL